MEVPYQTKKRLHCCEIKLGDPVILSKKTFFLAPRKIVEWRKKPEKSAA